MQPNGRLGIVDLLRLKGFDPTRSAKLVRHQDTRYDVLHDRRYDVHDLLRRGLLEIYQSYQSKPVFDGCDVIISFVGEEGTKARFIGVYRVLRRIAGSDAPLPPDFPYQEWRETPHFYQLEREPGFEDLENRVVIEWGKGALAWHQRLSNKEVVEVLPPGQFRPPFRDYLEFTLTHAELVELYHHQEANREWRARSAAIAGVYLILATTTGEQYVGSAYGTEGIWGRWRSYAANGHGGNKLLMDLCKEPGYPASFSYSILQILPKTFAKSAVIGWEEHYKEKLGSRAHGLNASELWGGRLTLSTKLLNEGE